MRLMIAAALAALPFATGAQAANVYSACYYGGYSKNLPLTQLFVLKGDALRDYYGGWTYEKNLEWEQSFPQYQVRIISGYQTGNFVDQFSEFAKAQGHRGECWVTTSRERAQDWFHKFSTDRGVDIARLRDWRPKEAGVLSVEDWSGRPSTTPATVSEPEPEATGTSQPHYEAAPASAPEAPVRPKKSNAQADAEYAAALAEYERQMAAHRQQIEDYKRAQEEVARTKEAQRLAAERKMDSYKRVLAEHERRQREYDASEARHRRCVSGNQQACADITAGKPALLEQRLAEAGPASTDTDANRCVTQAEVRLNATFQGNTSASVLNGCGQEVDVRICLKRGSDWNCGVDLAVGPQERAVHSSFNATGEVFVDARITGSSKRFANPPS